MFLLNYKKMFITGLILTCLLSCSGCGQKYESEITTEVKKSCHIPDSFKKVAYKADEKNGIAYLDFKAKNLLGVEIPHRIYFTISDRGFHSIPTDNIDKSILEEFYKEDIANFKQCVSSYNNLKKQEKAMEFDLYMQSDIEERLNTSERKNYFTWEYYKENSDKINQKLKKFKDSYMQAPHSVQKHFDKAINLKYTKVTLIGDWESWKAKAEKVGEFPGSNNS